MQRLLLPFFAATAIVTASGCGGPEGADPSTELASSTSSLSTCGDGQTAIDFSLRFSDGAEDKAAGCFTEGDDWFINGRMLYVVVALPGGDLNIGVRILHPDALAGAATVFPGPAGDAGGGYYTHDHVLYTSSAARLEVSEIALPQEESVPNGVLAGTLTAHLLPNVGGRTGELRVTFATRGIKAGGI